MGRPPQDIKKDTNLRLLLHSKDRYTFTHAGATAWLEEQLKKYRQENFVGKTVFYFCHPVLTQGKKIYLGVEEEHAMETLKTKYKLSIDGIYEFSKQGLIWQEPYSE